MRSVYLATGGSGHRRRERSGPPGLCSRTRTPARAILPRLQLLHWEAVTALRGHKHRRHIAAPFHSTTPGSSIAAVPRSFAHLPLLGEEFEAHHPCTAREPPLRLRPELERLPRFALTPALRLQICASPSPDKGQPPAKSRGLPLTSPSATPPRPRAPPSSAC